MRNIGRAGSEKCLVGFTEKPQAKYTKMTTHEASCASTKTSRVTGEEAITKSTSFRATEKKATRDIKSRLKCTQHLSKVS